jgi:hypothetical protein
MPPPVSRFLMPLPPLCHRCYHAAFFNTTLMRLRCRHRPAALLPPLCCRRLSCSANAVAVRGRDKLILGKINWKLLQLVIAIDWFAIFHIAIWQFAIPHNCNLAICNFS